MGLILPYWPLQQLKGRVLVKGKKLPAARGEDGPIPSDREEEEDEEEEEGLEAAEQRRQVSEVGWPGARYYCGAWGREGS